MAFFDKFKSGMNKTRSFILQNVFQAQGEASDASVFDEEQVEELEMTLLRTDMGAELVDELISDLRRELEEPSHRKISFVFEFLRSKIRALFGDPYPLRLNPQRLNMILLVGVNGSGKTTTAGKLAQRWTEEGNRVLLAAADTFRAAAIDQLRYWAERTGSQFVAQQEGADPAAVVFDAIKAAKARHCNAVIIDTAGRLQNKKNLMEELQKIRRVIDREAAGCIMRTLIVIDATTGQNALIQAKSFTEVSRADGICLTKLDGSAKGGVAAAVAKQCGCKILLAGFGEKAEDLLDFDPVAFTESLLPSAEELAEARAAEQVPRS